MFWFRATGQRLTMAALLSVFGITNALAQAQPPPTLSAESNDNRCGWALGGAAAALGLATLLGPKSSGRYTWTGLYVGGHVGCAWGDTDWAFQNGSIFSAA